MATLLELSEYLKVQAEVLRQRLVDSGQEPPGLDELLPQPMVDWLVSEFRSPGTVGAPPTADPSLSEEISAEDLESLDTSALGIFEEESPPAPGEELAQAEQTPAEELVAEPAPAASDIEPESPSEGELDEDRTVIQETLEPDDSPTSSDEPAEQVPERGIRPEEIDSRRSVGGLVFTDSERPVHEPAPPEPEDPTVTDYFLETLGQVESIRQDLGDDAGPPELEDFKTEEGTEEEPPTTDWETFEEPDSEVEPPEPPSEVEDFEYGEITSEDLQERVDRLFAELPSSSHLSATGEPIPPLWVQIREKLGDFYGALSLKQKFFITFAALASVFIFSAGVAINHRNYGRGGDERFYREGLVEIQLENLEGADSAFRKVISRYRESPLVPDSYFRLADVDRLSGDDLGAIRNLKDGLRIQQARIGEVSSEWSPEEIAKRWDGFEDLAELSASRQDWDSAIEWNERLLHETEEGKRLEKGLYGLANAYYNMALRDEAHSEDLRTALEAYAAAQDASPEAALAGLADQRLADINERLASREAGFSQSHLEKALEHYRNLLARGPETLTALDLEPLDVELDIARVHRDLGQIEESLAIFQEILARPRDEVMEGPLPRKVDFGLSRTLLERALVSVDAGKTDEALKDLEQVLERLRPNPDFPFTEAEQTEAVFLRGHAYYLLGRMHFASTGELQNPYYLKMDTAYQSALGRDRKFGRKGIDSLQAWMRRTNYLFQVNQDYSQAANSYEEILAEFPESQYSFLARFRLAEAYFALEQYAKAEDEYRRLVTEFPQTQYVDDTAFRQSYFQLGYCQFLLEEYEQAAATYKQLLGLIDYENSDEALQAWKRLAWAYYLQHRYDEAIEEYQALLQKYPERDTDGSIRVSLGRFMLERFDYASARDQFYKVVKEHSGGEMARWSRYLICESFLSEAKVATQEEKAALLASALEEAETIRSLYPDEDRILSIMGQIFFDMGDYTRAARELEYYKYAARDRTPPPEFQMRLAESYYRLADYRNAAINFRQLRIEELNREEQARALYLFAESLRLDGQLTDSIEIYERMLTEFPASAYHELAQGRVQEVRWNLSKGLQ